MKFYAIVFATTMCRASAFVPVSFTRGATSSSLNMVLEMPKETKKISKLEVLKVKSDHLIHPLREVRILIPCPGTHNRYLPSNVLISDSFFILASSLLKLVRAISEFI